MFQRRTICSQCSPIDRPVRRSFTLGTDGSNIDGRSCAKRARRADALLARLRPRTSRRSRSLMAMGASDAESTPPAMPASIWPMAILLPTRIAVSNEVAQACCTSYAGVCGARPLDRAASRVRLKSRVCLSTAPAATSPSRSPCNPKRRTIPVSTAVSMSRLLLLTYWVF